MNARNVLAYARVTLPFERPNTVRPSTREARMDLLIWLGGGAAALLALGALARSVWRINRRIVVIVDAVKELTPNGGRSIKDTVTRTEAKVDENTVKLCDLERRFDEHLADGQGPTS